MLKSWINKYLTQDYKKAWIQKFFSFPLSIKLYVINVAIVMRIAKLLSGAEFVQLLLGVVAVKMVVDSVSVIKKAKEALSEQE